MRQEAHGRFAVASLLRAVADAVDSGTIGLGADEVTVPDSISAVLEIEAGGQPPTLMLVRVLHPHGLSRPTKGLEQELSRPGG